jgi:peptide/nickel transport system substrate-binding protein
MQQNLEPTLTRRGLALAIALLLGGSAGLAWGQAKPPAAAEKPQSGGALNIGQVYYTVSPLSFDAADWTWKFNQDTGLTYEMLFAADLDKSERRGGKYSFRNDAWIPTDGLRGELAERWRVLENPWRVEIQLRKGVMFPAKEGVMAQRELTADDIVYAFDRLNKSPKKIATYYDHVQKVEAKDKHTVLFTFSTYNSEWDYRFGWGYYGSIQPREVAEKGASNWRHANGTGPFMLDNYIQGNSLSFKKNPVYWGTETIGGQTHKLPFVDQITYRVVKDEATMLTSLRTAKVDILEAVRWSAVNELKKSAPQIQWKRSLSLNTPMIALRTDTKPFDDVRVRRAVNMAVNKAEIAKTYWGGNAELLTHPMHPDWPGYFEPLSAMPDSIKEVFTHNPAKAKQLLAEAGYPNGFTFKTMVSSASVDQDMWAMVAAYLAKVGVKMEIQIIEYPAYLSAMGTKKHSAGYAQNLGGSNPTTSLRKSFMTGQYWNPSMYSDPAFDKKIAEMYAEPDERVRQVKARLLNREILEAAPVIWLPTPYFFTGWWPWVKNYGGELRAGAERQGPIHARIWIDQEMKKKMGF